MIHLLNKRVTPLFPVFSIFPFPLVEFYSLMYTAMQVFPALMEGIKSLEAEGQLIPGSRRNQLKSLAQRILELGEEAENPSVLFVCTANSRRSQLSEVWFRTAMQWYGISSFNTYSGGTEVTAFNYRMVEALERFGFQLHQVGLKGEDNPVMQINIGEAGQKQFELFSKLFDDPHNPDNNYIAVMVCDHADKNCPVVPGATARFSLPYEDPKDADGTDAEEETYGAKVMEVGREMLYLCRLLKRE